MNDKEKCEYQTIGSAPVYCKNIESYKKELAQNKWKIFLHDVGVISVVAALQVIVLLIVMNSNINFANLGKVLSTAVYAKNEQVEIPDNKHIKRIIEVADTLFAGTSVKDAIITSGSELSSRHGNNSKHYLGLALDIRSNSIKTYKEKKEIAIAFQTMLGDDYYVLFHWKDGYVEHYHIEYDPK